MKSKTKIRFNGKVTRVNYVCSTSVPSPDSRLWIIGNEFGPTHLVKAESFDEAWDEFLDDLEPIPEDEVPEAYGLLFYIPEDYQDDLQLEEGYEFKPNGSGGTGIVYPGIYAWGREFIQ